MIRHRICGTEFKSSLSSAIHEARMQKQIFIVITNLGAIRCINDYFAMPMVSRTVIRLLIELAGSNYFMLIKLTSVYIEQNIIAHNHRY